VPARCARHDALPPRCHRATATADGERRSPAAHRPPAGGYRDETCTTAALLEKACAAPEKLALVTQKTALVTQPPALSPEPCFGSCPSACLARGWTGLGHDGSSCSVTLPDKSTG
jgi:hypothetical protein